jgi:hypothetical protein
MQDVILKVEVTNPSDITIGTMAETVLDGADVTQGALADAAATDTTSSWSVVALLKGILSKFTKTQTVIKVVPVITTTPYSVGDSVGPAQTLTGALTPNGSGLLESLVLLDKSNQKVALDVLIFESSPAAATITDNSAFVFSTDDLKVIARVSIATGDYVTVASEAVAVKSNLRTSLKSSGGNNLYAAVIASTGSTPTYAVGALQFVWGFSRD